MTKVVIIITPETFWLSLVTNSTETEYQLTKSPIIIFLRIRLYRIFSSNWWFSKVTNHLANFQNNLKNIKLIRALQIPTKVLFLLKNFSYM